MPTARITHKDPEPLESGYRPVAREWTVNLMTGYDVDWKDLANSIVEFQLAHRPTMIGTVEEGKTLLAANMRFFAMGDVKGVFRTRWSRNPLDMTFTVRTELGRFD